ncbi:hypothetical protein [Sorangium sp. So ce385]|uniref:hypothetical protein n=1 Tax=Sorangium sp. So ce385 TaxID=3133308 RepID=UPI003F5BA6EA
MLDRAAAPARADSRREGVHVDALTRALLDVRFHVVERDGRCWIEEEREIGEGARTLLGKPSPHVGRERELRGLPGDEPRRRPHGARKLDKLNRFCFPARLRRIIARGPAPRPSTAVPDASADRPAAPQGRLDRGDR